MARVIRAERTGPSVVRAEVHDAKALAAEIIANAEHEVARLHDDALAQARDEARAELATAWLEVARARASAMADIDRAALEAALLVAGRIVGEAIEAQPARIANMLVPLLVRIRRARSISIRVHPSDSETLRAMLDDMKKRAALEGSIELVPDATITRGGCFLESSAGDIDARIETRIAEWKRILDRGAT